MAYMNLLVREYADLSDSVSEYEKTIAGADTWIQRALDTRREKNAESSQNAAIGVVGGASRPAPPPGPATESASPPGRITVRGGVMQLMLTSQTPPTYPLEAKRAGIWGNVLLRAIIARGGSVLQIGHRKRPPRPGLRRPGSRL